MIDGTFQKQFFADPAGVAAREFNLSGTSQVVGEANKTMFSLLNDPGFAKWSHQFQQQIETQFPTLGGAETVGELSAIVKAPDVRKRIEDEFAQGVVQHLSKETVAELRANSFLTKGVVAAEDDIAILLLVFVAVVVVVVLGKVHPVQDTVVLSRATLRVITNQIVGNLVASRVTAE
jgi:hypothetical protein